MGQNEYQRRVAERINEIAGRALADLSRVRIAAEKGDFPIPELRPEIEAAAHAVQNLFTQSHQHTRIPPMEAAARVEAASAGNDVGEGKGETRARPNPSIVKSS